MSYILILGGEFPLRERIVAGAIRGSGGLPVFTLAKSRTTPWLKFFDGVIDGDVMDPNDVVRAVKEYERETGDKPAAVIPMNDFVVRSGLAVAQAYGLTYNTPEVVEACRDKYVMKQVLKEKDVPIPQFGRFVTFEGLLELAGKIGFPLVVKPIELAGSVGVIKVESMSDLKSAFKRCIADIKALGGAFKTEESVFQAEEYIEAISEVSVEVINTPHFSRVLAVTEKYLGQEPYFVEVGHSVPSPHSSNRAVHDVAVAACQALGIQFGVAHVEMRIAPGGLPKVIEVGARTGGDTIMDLVERVYGINPYELHVASHLNLLTKAPEINQPRGLAAVAFIKARNGVIQSVKPPQVTKEVVSLNITAKPGDKSLPPLSWKDREGTIEFFWKNRQVPDRLTDHLRRAAEISETSFQVQG